jgi:hypothetical protein
MGFKRKPGSALAGSLASGLALACLCSLGGRTGIGIRWVRVYGRVLPGVQWIRLHRWVAWVASQGGTLVNREIPWSPSYFPSYLPWRRGRGMVGTSGVQPKGSLGTVGKSLLEGRLLWIDRCGCARTSGQDVQQPTKFLCLTLKLLHLQPDAELVQEFIQQDHFKYVKALGAFYLRLTGRPAEIYESLEPLHADYSKLKVRGMSEWKLMHVDEFVDELLTQPFACGIALPRLPFRQTLQQEGYLKEEGPRTTALREVLEEAGGLEEYLKYKVGIEKSPAAIGFLGGATREERFKAQRSP